MNRGLRWGLAAAGAAAGVLAAGFALRWGWATALWPLETGRLSYIFLGAMLAAIAAPLIWLAVTGQRRALAGGALNMLVSSAGMAVSLVLFWLRDPRPGLLALAGLSLALIPALVVLYRSSARVEFGDERLLPVWMRVSFWVFSAALLAAGGGLVLGVPNILPWAVSRENGVLYGWIFLGNLFYFLYGLRYPVWGNARGQMLAFLAYDLVLIGPLLGHFGAVSAEMRVSLVIYTAVVLYSGVLGLVVMGIGMGMRRRAGV